MYRKCVANFFFFFFFNLKVYTEEGLTWVFFIMFQKENLIKNSQTNFRINQFYYHLELAVCTPFLTFTLDNFSRLLNVIQILKRVRTYNVLVANHPVNEMKLHEYIYIFTSSSIYSTELSFYYRTSHI